MSLASQLAMGEGLCTDSIRWYRCNGSLDCVLAGADLSSVEHKSPTGRMKSSNLYQRQTISLHQLRFRTGTIVVLHEAYASYMKLSHEVSTLMLDTSRWEQMLENLYMLISLLLLQHWSTRIEVHLPINCQKVLPAEKLSEKFSSRHYSPPLSCSTTVELFSDDVNMETYGDFPMQQGGMRDCCSPTSFKINKNIQN